MHCCSREIQQESALFISSTAAKPDPELKLGAATDAKEQKVRIGHKIRAGAVLSTSTDVQMVHNQDGQPARQDSSQNSTVDVAMVLSLSLFLVLVYARTLWVKCCALKHENCKLRAQQAAIQKKIVHVKLVEDRQRCKILHWY